ncbi:MAG TPA: type IV pilus twitching motility protein PilT [Terriglobia bacterium]|nr:type IV pilus twitching motility protein PilT [Terriglobia bacterium]
MDILDLLREAVRAGASDLHLKIGHIPRLRVDGELIPLTQFHRISNSEMQHMAFSIMNSRHQQSLQELTEIELAYSAEDLGRFRVSVFHEMGELAMAVRIIPEAIRTIEQLHLPHVVHRFCNERRGLILVTGATGSGKSTTLAAMIDEINSSSPLHIITIEDPIEFYHTDKKAFISQREIGVDTPSFESALRSALRQDPDIILVGEMRDRQTIRTAIAAAETGHLVFSTLHTLDAQETVQRIVSLFSAADQKQIRLHLASTLKGIISQRLVRRADGQGRVPVAEVLVATEFIRDCVIYPQKTRLIRESMATGTSQYGMQTFDQSLYHLYSQGLITLDEACLWASSPEDLRLRASGIRSAYELGLDSMEDALRSRIERFAKG